MADWEKTLNDAISAKDIVKVKDLLAQGSELLVDGHSSYENVISKTLYETVSLGNLEITEILIKAGASVQYVDEIGQSVINRALSQYDYEVQEIALLLIENGADINHKGLNGNTDFMLSMTKGSIPYANVINLLDSVADIHEVDIRTGGSFLHLASQRIDDSERVRLIEKLLRKGVAINGLDNNDDTPLHLMANIGCFPSVRYLLENGADIKSRNRLGESVMHCLAYSNEIDGYFETLRLLMERGLDINDIDFKGRTVIHHALMSKDTTCDVLKEMQNYGVYVNRKDFSGRNEFFYAVPAIDNDYTDEDTDRRDDVIELLHQWNIAINEGDGYGITPLHIAISRDELFVVGALLKSGADVTKRTNTGATPLHWSCNYWQMAYVMISVYLKKGYCINIQDNYGSTPLHWAVWHRNIRVLQLLLQAGADFNMTDNLGGTPLDLANIIYYDDFALLLKSYETLKPLELDSEFQLECHGTDPLVACPLITSVRYADEEVDMTEHLEHIKMHENMLKRFIDINLSSTNMGLFFNIPDNIIVQDEMQRLMQYVVTNVSRQEPIFRCELHLAGSISEGTKVGVPDEFDYICNIVEFEKAFVPITSPDFPTGYVKLKLKDEALLPLFSSFVTIDGFLDCKRLYRQFYGIFNKEIENILESPESKFSHFYCCGLTQETRFSLSSISIIYYGQQAKRFLVNIDIVPAIYVENLQPEKKCTDRLTEVGNRGFPKQVAVVFKTLDRHGIQNFAQLFRVSYADMEQSLIKVQPEHIKKAYIILKALTNSQYLSYQIKDRKREFKNPITSYRLKTCFLHVLEDAYRTGDKSLTDIRVCDNATERNNITILWAEKVLQKFEQCVQEYNMPTYYDSAKNLLALECYSGWFSADDTPAQPLQLLSYLLKLFKTDVTT